MKHINDMDIIIRLLTNILVKLIISPMSNLFIIFFLLKKKINYNNFKRTFVSLKNSPNIFRNIFYFLLRGIINDFD